VGLKSAACTKAGTTFLVPIVRPHAPDFPGAPIVLSAQNRGDASYPDSFGKVPQDRWKTSAHDGSHDTKTLEGAPLHTPCPNKPFDSTK
jgi:hypothetical protein